METVGILCASDTELAPFLKMMDVCRTTEKAMLHFYEGRLRQIPAVAVYSGVCRVNAAIAAELLVEVFGVGAVVNAGTAGDIDPEARLFDTVIAEHAVYHDVAKDVLTEFHPWMPSPFRRQEVRGNCGVPHFIWDHCHRGTVCGKPGPGAHPPKVRAFGGGYGNGWRRPCVLCEPRSLRGGAEHHRHGGGQRDGGL